MKTLGKASKSLLGILFGAAVAYAVAAGIGVGYREGEILGVLVALTLPPLVLFLVYGGSAKRSVFCLGALMISAVLIDLSPAIGVSRSGLDLVLVMIGAMAIPVLLDLVFIDMSQQFPVERTMAQMTQVAFLLALFPLSGWALHSAHQTVLREDQKLIGELASRISPEGNSLVWDRLDPKMRDRAQRRLVVRTNNRTYPLSDADVESVREERIVRRETKARGVSKGAAVTMEQEERMRLILKLQGTAIPDDVVISSHRGPLTIYEVKVPINKHGS